MAILGHLIVGAHIAFFEVIQPFLGQPPAIIGEDSIRQWSFAAAAIAVSLWALVALILLRSASRVVPKVLGATRALGREEKELARVAEEIAIASGAPAGALRWYILETSAPNAFACGRSVPEGSIVVTRGLLNTLERDELQAVVAHELAHLKNGDALFVVQALAFAWMLVGISTAAYLFLLLAAALLVLTAWLAAKISEEADREWGGCIGMVVIAVIAGLGFMYLAAYALLVGVVLAVVGIGVKAAASSISQARELLADACSAQWTRNPEALASALAKITQGPRLTGLKGTLLAPLWFEHPRAGQYDGLTQRLLSFLFETHPPIGRRLELLKEMAGSKVGTDARWLATLRPGMWERVKRWTLPLVATLLAVAIAVMSVKALVAGGHPRGGGARSRNAERLLIGAVINQPSLLAPAVSRPGPPAIARLHKNVNATIWKPRADWRPGGPFATCGKGPCGTPFP